MDAHVGGHPSPQDVQTPLLLFWVYLLYENHGDEEQREEMGAAVVAACQCR